MPRDTIPLTPEAASIIADRLRAAIRDRCSCEGGPRELWEPHDPDCSLQNTGYLT